MRSYHDVVIVGGGHAGAQTAIALRQLKFAGSIAIIGDEPDAPYERPPLSKEYFAGEKKFERLLIRPVSFWEEREIDLMTGTRVTSVNPAERSVGTEDGSEHGYRHLVWATGGSPRRLACFGHDLHGVHTVRTRADTDRMLEELDEVGSVVVIGGGYIGLEAASGLVKKGKSVTLIEALPRVLARVAGEELSRFYEAEHRSRGVDIRLSAAVDCIDGKDGRVVGVRLADGETIAAAMVVVGIGIVPEVAPLLAAGAAGGNGVEVDEFCRTSLSDVHAVGDCAAHISAFADGERLRVESVQNANDQAMTAARSIVGAPVPYKATPWFWSNQYDLRLQTVGLSVGYDDVVLRGDVRERSFSLVYLRRGQVIALDCVNSTKDYVQGRKLVEASAMLDRERLAIVDTPLKEMMEPQGVEASSR